MGHVHPEEAAILHALRAGERHAFDRFYDEYFGRLYRFIRVRIDDERACEDIVQETLIKAIRGLLGFRGEAALFTWLCQIARSEISNWFLKNGRHLYHERSIEDENGNPLEIGSDSGGADDDVVITRDVVVRVLSILPDAYRQVLEMKYFEGLSVAQIAEMLSTGGITVQSTLARARRNFRDVYNTLTTQTMP